MPVVLKPQIVKYKDPDSGQYKTLTAITDDIHGAMGDWLDEHVAFTNGFITEEDGIVSAHVSEWGADSTSESENFKLRGFHLNDNSTLVAMDTISVSNDKIRLYSSEDNSIYSEANLGVAAVSNKIGTLSNLDTTAKSNLVSAINEVNNLAKNIKPNAFESIADYGATGDGSTDDRAAIQDALDASHDNGGGIVYFPAGEYMINNPLLFYSNQTLWFEPGAIIRQGNSQMDSLLRSYCETSYTGYNGVHDVLIYGGTFDGAQFANDITLVATVHAKNIIFEKCSFINAHGGWHNLEINSSRNVKVKDCIFDGTGKNSATGEMIQIDSVIEYSMYPWSGVTYDGTTSIMIDIDGCIFQSNTQSPAIGNHYTSTEATNQYIRIHNCIFDTLTSSRGAINIESHTLDVDIHDNTFIGCTTAIGYSVFAEKRHLIYNNRFVSCTTVFNPNNAASKHANMINGTFTV